MTSAGTGGVADDGDCLVLDTENVTIDGAGFTMTGNGDDTDGDGIRATSGNTQHYIIRNVRITNFDDGIRIHAAFFNQVQNVDVIGNMEDGIDMPSGQSNRVENVNAISNGLVGIRVGLRAILNNNMANGNDSGILATGASVVAIGNVADLNASNGISVDCPSVLIGNVSTANSTDYDLDTPADCSLANNVDSSGPLP